MRGGNPGKCSELLTAFPIQLPSPQGLWEMGALRSQWVLLIQGRALVNIILLVDTILLSGRLLEDVGNGTKLFPFSVPGSLEGACSEGSPARHRKLLPGAGSPFPSPCHGIWDCRVQGSSGTQGINL